MDNLTQKLIILIELGSPITIVKVWHATSRLAELGWLCLAVEVMHVRLATWIKCLTGGFNRRHRLKSQYSILSHNMETICSSLSCFSVDSIRKLDAITNHSSNLLEIYQYSVVFPHVSILGMNESREIT